MLLADRLTLYAYTLASFEIREASLQFSVIYIYIYINEYLYVAVAVALWQLSRRLGAWGLSAECPGRGGEV